MRKPSPPGSVAAAAIAVTLMGIAGPVFAQQSPMAAPALPGENGLGALIDKSLKGGPGSLSAGELVDLWDAQVGDDSKRGSAFGNLFGGELVWWWAAERGLNDDGAVAELARAYAGKHGKAGPAIEQAFRRHLVDLPAVGQRIYNSPPYVRSELGSRRQPPRFVGPMGLGPNEKTALSRLSNGVRRFVP
jgi:hypothetical protein